MDIHPSSEDKSGMPYQTAGYSAENHGEVQGGGYGRQTILCAGYFQSVQESENNRGNLRTGLPSDLLSGKTLRIVFIAEFE